MTTPRLLFWAGTLAVCCVTGVAAKTKFSSVWKAPEAGGVSFGGQKIAALVIDADDSLRVSGEEALANELSARGMQGVPSYRIVPKPVLSNAEEARGFFERAGIQGVVAFRVINDERRVTYQPATWSNTYYSTLWGYYGYGWGVVYDPGYKRDDRFISLESLVFSVPKNALIWAGMSTTENPKSAQAVVAEVVKEAVNEMRKQGLAKAAGR
jgi:hypothetical protein